MKIMIINDSRSMRLFLEEAIKEYGDCEIIGSHFDARLAVDFLKFKKPDIILLDLEMPHMDGLTFLDKVSKDKKIPIIIISNYVNDDSRLVDDAMSLGAVDSLALPSSNTPEVFKIFKNTLHHKMIKATLKQ